MDRPGTIPLPASGRQCEVFHHCIKLAKAGNVHNIRAMNEANNQRRYVVGVLIALAVLMLLGTMFTQREYPAVKPPPSQIQQDQAPAELLGPRPELTPQDVVRLIIKALQHNSATPYDEGIRLTFNFASPVNRRATGPLQRFTRMVKSPQYRLMLGHQRAEYGETEIQGQAARQRVTLYDKAEVPTVYVFLLSYQTSAPHAGCWMTDAVLIQPHNVQPWI